MPLSTKQYEFMLSITPFSDVVHGITDREKEEVVEEEQVDDTSTPSTGFWSPRSVESLLYWCGPVLQPSVDSDPINDPTAWEELEQELELL